MFDRNEILEANLERQIGFVRASESRIRFLLTALSVSLAIWATGFRAASIIDATSIVSGTFALLGIAVSVYHVWSSLFPKVTENRRSLLSF